MIKKQNPLNKEKQQGERGEGRDGEGWGREKVCRKDKRGRDEMRGGEKRRREREMPN